MNWIIENKEWIFSGIGIFLLGLVFRLLLKSGGGSRFSIRSGKNSTNIQINKNEK